MDRYVMRHPQLGGPVLIPASSMDHHRSLGWLRVSEAIAEENAHRVDPAGFADAPDLDASPAPDELPPAEEPAETTTPAAKPARTPKES